MVPLECGKCGSGESWVKFLLYSETYDTKEMIHWCRRVQSRAMAYQLISFESVKNANIATKDPLRMRTSLKRVVLFGTQSPLLLLLLMPVKRKGKGEFEKIM